MIKMTFIIVEENDGQVRFKGASEDVGGNPTNREVEFAEGLMKQVSNNTIGGFDKTEEKVPMTIIKTLRKKNEHTNRR